MEELSQTSSQIINVVLTAMSSKIGTESLNELRINLYRVLEGYDISPKTRDIVPYEAQLPDEYKYFLVAKKVEGKSDRTLKLYGDYIREALIAINKPLRQICANDIRLFFALKQAQTGCSNRTMDNRRGALSSFFSWLASEGYLDKSPMTTIPAYKYERKDCRSPLTKTQVEQLRSACSSERDRALLEFLYTSGARVSELVNLDKKDVDLTTGIVLLFGKGGKHRKSKISEAALVHLNAYLLTRADDCSALFVSTCKPYNRLQKASVESVIRNIGKRAGIENVFPHRLRHTFATDALRGGIPVTQLQALLGHSSLDTTMIYADVDVSDVIASHNRVF